MSLRLLRLERVLRVSAQLCSTFPLYSHLLYNIVVGPTLGAFGRPAPVLIIPLVFVSTTWCGLLRERLCKASDCRNVAEATTLACGSSNSNSSRACNLLQV
jgi:hypothetical protein